MKKLILFFLLFNIFFILTTCGKENTITDSIVEIKENMFITQINEINLNFRRYLGSTIKLKGFLKKITGTGRIFTVCSA